MIDVVAASMLLDMIHKCKEQTCATTRYFLQYDDDNDDDKKIDI